ncbi:hypothetical protein CMO89_00305 [Candidatus Woesearchaeota archaeon]|nr:hypothetical protein [Candidatus Woesearchaeota archaeon]
MVNDINTLIEKAKQGFSTLEVGDKYRKSALKWLKLWLTNDMFKEYVPQISYLIEKEKWDFLLDSFYQVIPFGTGGRRGLVGIGSNRINMWTIQASAQGHSQYLIKHYGKEAKQKGVVLAYDVREYTEKGVYNDSLPNPVMNLNCRQLAEGAAMVYAANGMKVYLFEDIRSTPELSFAIRYLKAVAGDMFSASHNLPTDNGKKVFDLYGGQLIPPFDQQLVDEVTDNVKEIKVMDFEKAKKNGLIEIIGKDIDDEYIEKVCSVSLSDNRKLKVIYSPLHGTGMTTYFVALKKLGFDVIAEPKTSYPNGAFENVTFNIPNPEVKESFDTLIPFAKKEKADITINSDPDSDRIGIMVNHKRKWEYLNGNEIGIILTQYGISKFREKGLLNDNTIIKTFVTTSLIAKMAENNNINLIGDLLVGFKYIGEEMNKLEKQDKMKGFILGAEESHGFIIDNYSRDKDGAAAAIWICELVAELKEKGKTLIDFLEDIYSEYGYCYNYLTEIRLLGAVGMEQIAEIMEHLRKNKIKSFGDFSVEEKEDRWEGKPFISPTDKVSRNIIIFRIKNKKNTDNIKVTVRPSGTEPKIKMYFELFGKPFDITRKNEEFNTIKELKERLEREVMRYCYKILDIDFPGRGFLLFWQLPLNDKLKYFEIEEQVAGLKNIKNKKERKKKLDELLAFLGSNPVEKVNKAFKGKYNKDLLNYLEL